MKKRFLRVCKKLSYRHWRRQFLRTGLRHVGVITLGCSLVILFGGCSGLFPTPSQSGTPLANPIASTPTPTSTAVVSPTPTFAPPTITLQVIACPSNLSLNWDNLVGTHANINKVQKVICGSLEGPGTLDALVDVRYYSPEAKLDLYVYDNLFGTPARRFSVLGLLKGDALISSVGTLITGEASPYDVIKGAPDLYKEYQWNGSTFGQILFPGIYPDVTRYQGEQNQAIISSELAALQPGQPTGQIRDAWRLAPGAVTAHLAETIFHWLPANFTVTLPPGASKLSVLSITVTNHGPGGGGFIATLHHLNEVPTNVFEVWQVSSIDGSSRIINPPAYARLTSPVSISGSSIASGNIVGMVVLYDDMYINVGDSGTIQSPASSGYMQFEKAISYHLNAQGLEEGIVAFYSTSQNNAALSNQVVLVKVFLSA